MDRVEAWLKDLPPEHQEKAREFARSLRERVSTLPAEMQDSILKACAFGMARLLAIEGVIKSDLSVRQGMDRVLALCTQDSPSTYWRRFLRLSIEEDVLRLRTWIEFIFAAEPPPEDVTCLWFGLFNPIRAGETSADLHIQGAPYNLTDPDWATRDPWVPSTEDANSKVLDEIYRLANFPVSEDPDGPRNAQQNEEDLIDEFGHHAEYSLCLAYAGLAVRSLFKIIAPSLLLAGARERVVCVGFNSGDRLCVGRLTAAGLEFSKDTDRMI